MNTAACAKALAPVPADAYPSSSMKLADLVAFNTARAGRRAAVLVTDLAGGAQRVVHADAVAADPLVEAIDAHLRAGRSGAVSHEGRDYFLTVHTPDVRLVVVGAVHITQALLAIARLVDLDVTIVDPRSAFATPERFPDARLFAEWPEEALPRLGLDAHTGVLLLSHDPKIDDPALVAALEAGCFYVGALGSRKTHARRLDRMRERGFSDADLDRIHAPVGLDIGAVTPAEIAVAIVAEVIAARQRKPRRTAEAAPA